MDANSRKCKSQKTSHVVEEVATLSDFPDEILQHILSFLDTKSAVRTSLLSRRWRCLWKTVQVLNFLPKSFCKLASFRKHVYRLLSFRSYRAPVRNVIFDLRGYTAEVRRGHVVKTIEQVMKYAASHDGGGLDSLSITGGGDYEQSMNFFDFDYNVISGNHDASLKTMKLEKCVLWSKEFDDGSFKWCTTLGFKSLTTLELRECSLSPDPQCFYFDLIGDLPCLKHLKLLHCYLPPIDILLISGPQLLDLEMEFKDHYLSYKLIAPKLKSVRLWSEYIDKHLPKLDLPCLDHANIRLKWEPYLWADDAVALEESSSAFVNYLRGLHNVESLNLCVDKEGGKDCEEHQFPLNRIKPVIEHEASPFTRLKKLRIQCAHQQRSPNLPYQVLRYFLEGSPNMEDKFVKIEMLAD